MDSEKGPYGNQSRSGKALEKEADTKSRDNESNADSKDMSTGSKGSGLIGRVVDSASKLAGSVARSATQGSSAFDPSLLSEQKTGVQQGSSSMSHEWIAENRPGTLAAWAGQAAGTDKPSMAAGPSNAASAFRQTARMSDIHSSSLLGNTANGHVAGQAESHQVQLAQNIDGRGVVDFLSQPMPTSMSTVIPGQGAAMSTWHPARQMRPQAANTIETTDPIAYLQGTSYAADMELADHQVPSNPQTAAANATSGNSGSLHSSPSGLIKSWSEHGASILEEWELNEAWDRAWMDTAWQTAKKPQKDSEEEPKPEPVVPTNRNLSNLLKPRI